MVAKGLNRVPLSSTQTPSVQHISSTQKGHSFSAPKIPQFHTKNPSVPHQKTLSSTPPLSSTPKTPQFHTKKLYTNELYSYFSLREVELRVFEVEMRGVC